MRVACQLKSLFDGWEQQEGALRAAETTSPAISVSSEKLTHKDRNRFLTALETAFKGLASATSEIIARGSLEEARSAVETLQKGQSVKYYQRVSS